MKKFLKKLRLNKIFVFISILFVCASLSFYSGAIHILHHQGHSLFTVSHSQPPLNHYQESWLSRLLISYQSLKEILMKIRHNPPTFKYKNVNTNHINPKKTFTGYTLLTHYGKAEIILVDMNGDIVHSWYQSPHKMFNYAINNEIVARSAELLPDGSIICIYESTYNTPYGVGIACLDKNSKVLWKKPINAHHSHIYDPDKGTIVLTHREIMHKDTPILEDEITFLNLNGKLLDSIAISDLFVNTSYENFIPQKRYDYLHANSIEFIHTPFKLGNLQINKKDILISLRNINVIAILDYNTLKVKWAIKDRSKMQHSPTQTTNGDILIFDNLGNISNINNFKGISRIITINPQSLEQTWIYQQTNSLSSISALAGSNAQALPNLNVLACISNSKIIEISQEKEVVWQLNFPVIFAKRYPLKSISYSNQ